MEPIVRTWPRLAALAITVALLAALAVVGVQSPRPADATQYYTPAQQAFITEMARIHRVPSVDPEGALVGGRNACYWIDRYGINPATLDGWQQHWSEPWERDWLAAAVQYLCPG